MLGIIGGSGLYELKNFEVLSQERIITPYGTPSADVQILKSEDINEPIAFLPRHGVSHSILPHRIPYKANIAALKSVGVDRIVATCIAGSLQLRIKPGDFIVPDQFVDFTRSRDNTFEDDGRIQHTALGDPYCSRLRAELISACSANNIPAHAAGTVVVIQGPRFATRAESIWYAGQGWDIINMTQYPECLFARENGICYACIAAITDYDVGLGRSDYSLQMAVARESILPVFQANIAKLQVLLRHFVKPRSNDVSCGVCGCRELSLPYFQTT